MFKISRGKDGKAIFVVNIYMMLICLSSQCPDDTTLLPEVEVIVNIPNRTLRLYNESIPATAAYINDAGVLTVKQIINTMKKKLYRSRGFDCYAHINVRERPVIPGRRPVYTGFTFVADHVQCIKNTGSENPAQFVCVHDFADFFPHTLYIGYTSLVKINETVNWIYTGNDEDDLSCLHSRGIAEQSIIGRRPESNYTFRMRCLNSENCLGSDFELMFLKYRVETEPIEPYFNNCTDS